MMKFMTMKKLFLGTALIVGMSASGIAFASDDLKETLVDEKAKVSKRSAKSRSMQEPRTLASVIAELSEVANEMEKTLPEHAKHTNVAFFQITGKDLEDPFSVLRPAVQQTVEKGHAELDRISAAAKDHTHVGLMNGLVAKIELQNKTVQAYAAKMQEMQLAQTEDGVGEKFRLLQEQHEQEINGTMEKCKGLSIQLEQVEAEYKERGAKLEQIAVQFTDVKLEELGHEAAIQKLKELLAIISSK